MQSSRLCSLLKALSTRERSRFREFLYSPYHNKREKIRQLFDHMAPFAPHFDHPDLNKPWLFQQLFGDAPYSDPRINNVISDCLHLLYDFLAQEQFRQQDMLKKDFTLEALLNREAHRDIDRLSRWYREGLDRQPQRNADFYYKEHLLYDKLDRFFFTKGQRSYDANLQRKSDSLDVFYLASKFRIACDMASRNTVTEATYECHLLEDLLRYYQAHRPALDAHTLIGVFYKTLLMLTEREQEQHYYDLKAQLAVQAHLFTDEELRELYIYPLNYCIKKINSGRSDYYAEVLDIYKMMLDKKIAFRNGFLPQWTFKNISTVGIRLKAYEWTAHFIDRYEQYLLPEERDNALAFNRAALFYAKKDFKQALQTLHNVDFVNTSYHLGAKIIQLKSYYELQETEALYALIEASKKFIRRNRQLSEYGKKANLNFFKMARRIHHLRSLQSTESEAVFSRKYKTLLESIGRSDSLANKDWLEETIRSLVI